MIWERRNIRKIGLLFLFLYILNLNASIYNTGIVLDKRVIGEKGTLKIEELKVKTDDGEVLKIKNFLWSEKNYNTLVKKGEKIWFRIDEYGGILCGFRRDFYVKFLVIFTFVLLFTFLGKKRIFSVFSILINLFLFIFIFLPFIKKGVNPIISVLI
ncbi:MAG: hypothetical protein DRI36_02730, partial [Caldiserica bacterium]